jgi:iron complex transport system ATP-binding protein
MLSASALAIGYPRRILASDIALTLQPGEAVAILGPNGAGKTTLFRTLLGLLPARAGAVSLDGKPISLLTAKALAQAIAYVPQAASGFFNFSVIEVVEMARAAHLPWYAQPGASDRRIAEAALEELNITQFAQREFAELSGGERQLVLIARALATQAGILLLDEPTASLDYGNQFLILDELARLKSRGVSILFTTHDPNQALRIADRTLTLSREGEIGLGATCELVTRASMARLYGINADLLPGSTDGWLAAVAHPGHDAATNSPGEDDAAGDGHRHPGRQPQG